MANNNTAPLQPKIADRLLDLLGDSDKFRELFQQDPAYALQLVGHEGPSALEARADASTPSISGCLSVRELASKDVIRAARTELRTMLLAGLAQISPLLEATRSDD